MDRYAVHILSRWAYCAKNDANRDHIAWVHIIQLNPPAFFSTFTTGNVVGLALPLTRLCFTSSFLMRGTWIFFQVICSTWVQHHGELVTSSISFRFRDGTNFQKFFYPTFFLLHLNPTYMKRILHFKNISPLIIGSKLTFISSSGRWLPTI